MNELPDDVTTDLITAIVAARADGDGVLTLAAVRGRFAAAKLRVERTEARIEQQGHCGRGDGRTATAR